MTTNTRPGVYVDETLRPSLAGRAQRSPVPAFIGEAQRGPVTPTLINSWTEYFTLFGGFPEPLDTDTELPFGVYSYFQSGGGQCYVCRVLAADSTQSTLVIQDDDGTPSDTLTVDAKYPGIWGDSVYVQTIDKDISLGVFDLIVYHGGVTSAYVVERWVDLSMDSTDPRFIESVMNATGAGSKWVTVTDMGSPSVGALRAPTETSPTVLTAGSDGSTVTSTDFSTTVSKFDTVSEGLVMAIPGASSTTTVANALLTYCDTRQDSFAVVDPASTATAASVQTYVAGLSPATSYGATYFPWIEVANPASNRIGSTRLVPPSGAVIGTMMKTDRERGPFKAPAGEETRIPGAVDVAVRPTMAELDILNGVNVNVVRAGRSGQGVRIMGARTLKTTGVDRYIPVRRSLIYVRQRLVELTEFSLFEPNDAELWAQIRANIAAFLTEFRARGGLRGSSNAEAFFVKCDSDINTTATIEAGELHIEVGVALQYPTEFIRLRLAQWEGGTNVEEVA